MRAKATRPQSLRQPAVYAEYQRTHGKTSSMDFVTGLPMSKELEGNVVRLHPPHRPPRSSALSCK